MDERSTGGANGLTLGANIARPAAGNRKLAPRVKRLAPWVKRLLRPAGNLSLDDCSSQARPSTSLTPTADEPQPMDYGVFDLETCARLDTLELYVLARVYRVAWRAVHGTTPKGRHPMPMFNVFFEFDDSSGSKDQVEMNPDSHEKSAPATRR